MLADNLIRDLIDKLRDCYVDYSFEINWEVSESQAIQLVRDCFKQLKGNPK